MGPTGSGKTSIASRLDPEEFEIVSVDSRQIYKRLEISSAAPDPSESQNIQHHLVSIIEPSEQFDAAEFVKRAHIAIMDILQRGKTPMLVGGAGFYFKALRSGGPVYPGVDREIEIKLKQMTAAARLKMILKMAPDRIVKPGQQPGGQIIHSNDDYRITRALQIIMAEKQRSSGSNQNQTDPQFDFPVATENHEYIRQKNIEAFKRPIPVPPAPKKYSFNGFWLQLDKTEYWKILESRVHRMIEKGMVEEIEAVHRKFGDCPGLQSLGCKDVLKYISGEIDKQKLVELIFISHRQYGKRQRTWFAKVDCLQPVHPNDWLSRSSM